jgi:hypothetical protein
MWGATKNSGSLEKPYSGKPALRFRVLGRTWNSTICVGEDSTRATETWHRMVEGISGILGVGRRPRDGAIEIRSAQLRRR